MKDVDGLIFRKINKKPILTMLFLLKSGPKRWSELEKWINKRYLHESTVALIDLGLVEATILRDTPTGSKAYKLTPLGQKIVSLIEQMEKEFEDYHRKVSLPEDAGEFINEPLEEE